MFVYLGIFSLFGVLATATRERQAAPVLFMMSVFLVWFMGFRFEVGCDYWGYYHRWVHFREASSLGELIQENEPGFNGLMALIKGMGLDYYWLNVAVSAILVACYAVFARAHRFSLLILALLFPVIIVQLGMSGIRQAIAGGFLMVASVSFVKGSRVWTAFWILVGMQFHTSAIIFLPLALLAGRDVSTARLALAVVVLGPAAAFLLADRFDTYADRYIEQAYGTVTASGGIVRYALVLIPALFFPAFRKPLKLQFPDVYPFLKLTVLVILALAPLIALSTVALHRMNYYVMPFSILLFVYLGAVAFRQDKRIVGAFLALLAYGAYSTLWFLTSSHAASCYIPYQNELFLSGF